MFVLSGYNKKRKYFLSINKLMLVLLLRNGLLKCSNIFFLEVYRGKYVCNKCLMVFIIFF